MNLENLPRVMQINSSVLQKVLKCCKKASFSYLLPPTPHLKQQKSDSLYQWKWKNRFSKCLTVPVATIPSYSVFCYGRVSVKTFFFFSLLNVLAVLHQSKRAILKCLYFSQVNSSELEHCSQSEA